MHARLDRFIDDLYRVRTSTATTDAFLEALRPPFEALMAERDWMQDEWLNVIPGSVASWAIYRNADPGLCVFAMVVPPGGETKVHNHLSSGWIGLYQGEQLERKFLRVDPGDPARRCDISEVDRLSLVQGALTFLRPPEEDIHQIRTVSEAASVSIHVLSNDLGTVRRQQFYPADDTCEDFVSGYSNDTAISGAEGIGRL